MRNVNVCALCCRINSCVGQGNHRSFLLTLCAFLLTSLNGITLVLRSLCPQQYLVSALFYCPGVYSQSRYARQNQTQSEQVNGLLVLLIQGATVYCPRPKHLTPEYLSLDVIASFIRWPHHHVEEGVCTYATTSSQFVLFTNKII